MFGSGVFAARESSELMMDEKVVMSSIRVLTSTMEKGSGLCARCRDMVSRTWDSTRLTSIDA